MKKISAIVLALVLCLAAMLSTAGGEVAPGSFVIFGSYPQESDGDDQTSIEWIVLDVHDGKALLTSKLGLDVHPYNDTWTDVTWESCTLRTWLNGEFLEKAFSAEEQAAILVTEVDNSADQNYSDGEGYAWADGGNSTRDRVFLLSYREANLYFGAEYGDKANAKACLTPTYYAVRQGARTSFMSGTEYGASTWWWLRSPAYNLTNAAIVDLSGPVRSMSNDNFVGVIRPALWLDLDSEIFRSEDP